MNFKLFLYNLTLNELNIVIYSCVFFIQLKSIYRLFIFAFSHDHSLVLRQGFL
ncbi:hypothetical protein ABS324_27250 (plasmid) [Bacillus cereus]|uniref:hypothetical protein n=1 Tax=Bacillus cereus TaxID=1396 RepID=UPI00331492D9